MAPKPPTPINAPAVGAQEPDAYLRTKVLTARPEELRLMLLDGAIKFAIQGRDGLTNKDYEASFTGLSQSRDIVLELMTSVSPDVEIELAERIKSLYSYMYSELVSGSFERDAAKIDRVIELLTFERETWALAMERLREAPGQAPEPPTPSDNAPGAPATGTTPAAPVTSLSLEA